MSFRVVVTPEAERDLRNAVSYIRRDNVRAAAVWLKGVRNRIKSLANQPDRCPLAPESDNFDEPIRELFFGAGNRGTYRILFVVYGQNVIVIHVRHGSMLPLGFEPRPE